MTKIKTWIPLTFTLPTVYFDNQPHKGFRLEIPERFQRPVRIKRVGIANQAVSVQNGDSARWVVFVDPENIYADRTGYPLGQDEDFENLGDLCVLDLAPASPLTAYWDCDYLYYDGDGIYFDCPGNGNPSHSARPIIELTIEVDIDDTLTLVQQAASRPLKRPVQVPAPSPIKLQLEFEGANNSVSIVDSSTFSRTGITCLGTARICTTSPIKGTSSLLIDGSGGAVTVPASADFLPGSGEFTIDMKINPANTTAGGRSWITVGNTYTPYMIWSDGANIFFYASKNGTSWDAVNGASLGTITANTTTKLSVQRKGDNFQLFNNGVKVGSDVAITGALCSPNGLLYIGAQGGATANTFNIPAFGKIDEVSFTKGVAKY